MSVEQLDIDAIENRLAEAAKGTWRFWPESESADPDDWSDDPGEYDDFVVGSDLMFVGNSDQPVSWMNVANEVPDYWTARFIANAKRDIEALLAEVKRLREQVSA